MPTTNPGAARAALGLTERSDVAQREPSDMDKRITYTRSLAPAFADAVASGLTPETLVRDAITAVRNLPDLVKCAPETFAGALMTAAQLGLRPNVAPLGHGWVLPFYSGKRKRHEAQWVLGYQGMVELGYRSGLVHKITAHTIYEGEPHRVRWGTKDVLEHEPLQNVRDRGEALWHYAVVWLTTGGVVWNALPEAEVQQVMRDHVKGAGEYGPWRDNYEAMARKTALRGLWRFMPKSPVLALALDTDGAIREGTERDPSVAATAPEPVEQPQRQTVTVEREPVAADEPPPDEPPADVEPDPEPVPDTFRLDDGTTRRAFDDNAARQAHMRRAQSKHGALFGDVVVAVIGQGMPSRFLSTAELKRIADADTATGQV